MKRVFSLVLVILVAQSFLCAQEFSFEMYFEDSLGNRDTIILGYDALGTEYIDSIFGEQDILNGPKRIGLDVRVVQYIYNNPTPVGTVATKKQILPTDCDNAWPYVQTGIEITTNNWPVTASWDKSLFNDSCRLTSLFTSVHPGGWFDTGSPSDLWIARLQTASSATFTSQVTFYGVQNRIDENYAYLDTNADTVSRFWFTFNYDFGSSIALQTATSKAVIIFPNPTYHQLYFNNIDIIQSVNCFALDGRQIEFVTAAGMADVSTLPIGVYFLQLNLKNGQQVTRRFVKQ